MQSISKELLGFFCIALLKTLNHIPKKILSIAFSILLPFYLKVRRKHIHRVSTLLKEVEALFTGPKRDGYAFNQISSSLPTEITKHSPILSSYYETRFLIALNTLQYWNLPPVKRVLPTCIQVEGLAYYESVLKSNQPILAFSIHTGLFESLHDQLAVHAQPFKKNCHTLIAPTFSNNLTRQLETWRGQPGKKLVYPMHNLKAMKEWIQHQDVLAVMIDVNTKSIKLPIKLWGKVSLPFDWNLFSWAAKQNTVFLPLYSIMGPVNTVVFEEPLLAPTPHQIKTWVEKIVEQNPLQWNWSYVAKRQ